MARTWKIVVALVVGVLALAAAVTPGYLRGRVRRTLREQCTRRLDAHCDVTDVQLALDGVLLRDVTVTSGEGLPRVRVGRVGARFGWLRALVRIEQSLDVLVDDVHLDGELSPVALKSRVDGIRERPDTGGSTSRRFRAGQLHVTHVAATLRLDDRTHRGFDLSLRDGELRSDGVTSQVQWTDLAVVDPQASLHAGRCTHDVRLHDVSSRCEGFEVSADVGVASALADVLRENLRALRPASEPADVPNGLGLPRGVDTPEVTTDAGTELRVSMNASAGTVILRRGDETLVRLTPARITASVHGHTLEEVQLGSGDPDAHEPMLGLTWNHGDAGRWRVTLDASSLPITRVAPWLPIIPFHAPHQGTLRARVQVSPIADTDSVETEGEITFEGFGLEHPGLAREPIDGLTASVSGRAVLDPVGHRVVTSGIDVRVNGIAFSMAGSVERTRDHTALDVAFHLPSVECDLPRRALPRPVVGPLAGFQFGGTLAADGRLQLDTRRLSDTVLDFEVQNGCQVAAVSPEIDLRRFSHPFVQRVHEPRGVVRTFVTGPGAPTWTSFEAISPFVTAAVVSREDGGFYRHHGFAIDEIRGALVRNIAAGRFAYGASTISMQLVKNVLLAREKTLVRKLQEVALTWWIETSMDKSSILELYLNVVEFGPGIYGIGPASRFFFRHEPSDLTLLEALYLATLLPAPVPRYGNFERGTVSNETLAMLRRAARAMAGARLVTAAEAEAAQHEGIEFRRRDSAVPGAMTLTVDPSTTDAMAGEIATQQGFRVVDEPAAPSNIIVSPPDELDDGPRREEPPRDGSTAPAPP